MGLQNQMSEWETTINTGNPRTDQETLQRYKQQAAAQGLNLQVQPLPSGGFQVQAVRAKAPSASANDFDDGDMKTVVGTTEEWNNEKKPASSNDFDDEGAKTIVATDQQIRSAGPVAPPPKAPPPKPAQSGLGGVGVAKPMTKPPIPTPAKPPGKSEFDDEGIKTVVATDEMLNNPGALNASSAAKKPGKGEFAENELKTMVATEEQLSSGPMPALLGVTPAQSLPALGARPPAPAQPSPSPGGDFGADKVQETLVVPEGYSQSLYGKLPNQQPPPGGQPPGVSVSSSMIGPPPMMPPGHVPGAVPLHAQQKGVSPVAYVMLGLAAVFMMAGVATVLVVKAPYGILAGIMCLGATLICGGLGYQKLQQSQG